MGLLFYYKDKDDIQQGPFDSKELRALIKVGAILPLTDLRTDQMDRWVHAFNLKNAFPDYVPSQEQPSRPKKTWGTRYALHLLKNPFVIVAILGAVGMVFAAYRSLELPWLFPPNKMPSPVASTDLAVETPAPLVKENATQEKEEEKEEPKSADPLSGNSPAGQIHRGIMGEQWCIKPRRMFPLPYSMSVGRFFFDDVNGRVILSAINPIVRRSRNSWSLPGLLISDYASNGQKQAMCHVKSYSQINRQFSRIASTLEGLLVVGSLDDWKDLAGQDRKLNYQINTGMRHLLPHQLASVPSGNVFAVYDSPEVLDSQRASKVSIAVSKSPDAHGSRIKMAISALYPDPQVLDDGKPSQLDKYHRLVVVSPQGIIIAQKAGPTLSSLSGNRAALEEASPYQEIVFSRNADYLAGRKATGEIDILHADTLKPLFTAKGVHMGGPYKPSQKFEVTDFAGHRLSFSERDDLLLANDRGQVVIIDIRTEKVHRFPLQGLVQTCCFIDGSDIMAASTETGEVYRINPYSGEVVTKALLAGLGPLTSHLNFSEDGESLSGIFDEGVHVVGIRDSHGPPVRYAMFWDLHLLNDPSSKVVNQYIWSCQHPYRDEYPGHRGSFVGFTRPNIGTLSVVISNTSTKELASIPIRTLTPEAQKKAILLHSLVERTESSKLYDPKESAYTYEIPEWKALAKNALPRDQDKRFTARPDEGIDVRSNRLGKTKEDRYEEKIWRGLRRFEEFRRQRVNHITD